MSDVGALQGDRLALVEKLATSMYDRLVRLVIADVKALPDNCRQSGDDSPLKNVWEEFKDQLQNEESFFFEAYVETIQVICDGHVAELDVDRQRFLWLWSDGYLQQWVDEDEVRLADLDVNHVTDELYRRLCDVAANESLFHELEDDIKGLWPSDWPGQTFVELENVGDPEQWLRNIVGEEPSAILQNLPEFEEDYSHRLSVEYLRAIAEQGFDLPWSNGDHPSDPDRIAACQAGIRQEFVLFLRDWRERAAEELEKMNPPAREAD